MFRSIVTPRLLRKVHRRLGLTFAVIVFASAGSGVLHTVMSRTTPPPPPARPDATGLDTSAIRVSVPEAVKRLGDDAGPIRSIHLRPIGGKPWYQIFAGDGQRPHYVNADDGTRDDSKDERHAAEIAGRTFGTIPVGSTSFLTRFDHEYGAIFRILPVYRFDANDSAGTRVYVSTTTGSVTLATNDAKAAESAFFSLMHKWMFIRNKDLRDSLLSVAMLGLMSASLAGIVLHFATRPRRKTNSASHPAGGTT